jgi:hypothetical protein
MPDVSALDDRHSTFAGEPLFLGRGGVIAGPWCEWTCGCWVMELDG